MTQENRTRYGVIPLHANGVALEYKFHAYFVAGDRRSAALVLRVDLHGGLGAGSFVSDVVQCTASLTKLSQISNSFLCTKTTGALP